MAYRYYIVRIKRRGLRRKEPLPRCARHFDPLPKGHVHLGQHSMSIGVSSLRCTDLLVASALLSDVALSALGLEELGALLGVSSGSLGESAHLCGKVDGSREIWGIPDAQERNFAV